MFWLPLSQKKSKLDDLQRQIENLYWNNQKDFLSLEISVAGISNLKDILETIKVMGTDFNIEYSVLPLQVKQMVKLKEATLSQLMDVSDKLQLQEVTDKLFIDKLPNWQKKHKWLAGKRWFDFWWG